MSPAGILEYFDQLPDPRVERTRLHKLIDIVAIALCAVICGADGWVAVETYGHAKESWLRTWLELPNGIPSHDTFGRVFARLDPQKFLECFGRWMAAVQQASSGQLVAIDGKTLRGSGEGVLGQGAIHLVSAWAAANHMVLAQARVEEGSNEITAIPQVLEMLDLEGCVVTIDAIGCQRDIAAQVVAKGGDYVLQVKANQGQLHEDLQDLFGTAQQLGFRDLPHDYECTLEKDHGRIERRECWAVDDAESLAYLGLGSVWAGLGSVAMVKRQRRQGKQTSVDIAYYISSLPGNARRLLAASRRHWGIENSLHWVLDVAFDEDRCRVRKGQCRRELRYLAAYGPDLTQARQVRQSWHPGQTAQSCLEQRLPPLTTPTIRCDCPGSVHRAIASKLGGRVLGVGMGKQQGGVVSWLLLHC